MVSWKISLVLAYYLALLGGGYWLFRLSAPSPAVAPAVTVTPFAAHALPPSGTFFPGGGVGVAAVDGLVGREPSPPELWKDIHNNPGTIGAASDPVGSAPYLRQEAQVAHYDILRRAILQFDTASLSDEQAIESARLEVIVNSAGDTIGGQEVVVTMAKPTASTAIQPGDYASIGREAFSDPILVQDIEQKSTLVFPLNAAGMAHIARQGTSQFALVFESDRTNKEPAWIGGGKEAYLNIDFTEGTQPPRLVVKVKE